MPPGYPVWHLNTVHSWGFSAQKHLTAHQCKRQSNKANTRSKLQMAIIYLQFHGVPHTVSILDPSALECSQTGPHWRSHISLTLENTVLYSLCLPPSSPVTIILDSTLSSHSLPLKCLLRRSGSKATQTLHVSPGCGLSPEILPLPQAGRLP